MSMTFSGRPGPECNEMLTGCTTRHTLLLQKPSSCPEQTQQGSDAGRSIMRQVHHNREGSKE